MNDHRSPFDGRPVSYKVSVWRLEKYKGKRKTSYIVRWTVDGARFRETFGGWASADAHRSALVSAHKRGEPFDVREGRPVSWLRESLSWYELACQFVDSKWPRWSGNSRASAQEALTTATEALLSTERGKPDRRLLRAALRDWAFSTRVHGDEPPDHLRGALAWIERNTLDVSALTDAAIARAVLDRISRTMSGELAAAHTVKRRRSVVSSAFNYACERRLLPGNPFAAVRWSPERVADTVNPAVVVNPRQAKALLAEVGKMTGRAQRVYAFLALMYYAGLRPEEAIGLTADTLRLPKHGWGEVALADSEPRPGTKWTQGRTSQETRQLKNRSRGERRPVPAHPELVAILRWHIAEFTVPPAGRLFVGPRGGRLTSSVYNTAFHAARSRAFTPEEAASPLARTPYDLRHACVSTWLATGATPQQVAGWAGHSVAVLHRVYAKCIAGQEQAALKRIEDAMEEMSRAAESTDSQGELGEKDDKTSGRIRGEHPSSDADSG